MVEVGTNKSGFPWYSPVTDKPALCPATSPLMAAGGTTMSAKGQNPAP